ncbi:MAG TPA: hypothetical protein VGF76_11225, partial [Polyangiaceae bacterium]
MQGTIWAQIANLKIADILKDIQMRLAEHECLLLKTGARSGHSWPLLVGKRALDVKVKGRRLSDNGAITRRWALAGYGVASPQELTARLRRCQ